MQMLCCPDSWRWSGGIVIQASKNTRIGGRDTQILPNFIHPIDTLGCDHLRLV